MGCQFQDGVTKDCDFSLSQLVHCDKAGYHVVSCPVRAHTARNLRRPPANSQLRNWGLQSNNPEGTESGQQPLSELAQLNLKNIEGSACILIAASW